MGRVAKESESLVIEIFQESSGILSTAGHEKSCWKLPGPSGKPKYYQESDSEPVPWGKGEKNPGRGSEIDPETICLQKVRAR